MSAEFHNKTKYTVRGIEYRLVLENALLERDALDIKAMHLATGRKWHTRFAGVTLGYCEYLSPADVYFSLKNQFQYEALNGGTVIFPSNVPAKGDRLELRNISLHKYSIFLEPCDDEKANVLMQSAVAAVDAHKKSSGTEDVDVSKKCSAGEAVKKLAAAANAEEEVATKRTSVAAGEGGRRDAKTFGTCMQDVQYRFTMSDEKTFKITADHKESERRFERVYVGKTFPYLDGIFIEAEQGCALLEGAIFGDEKQDTVLHYPQGISEEAKEIFLEVEIPQRFMEAKRVKIYLQAREEAERVKDRVAILTKEKEELMEQVRKLTVELRLLKGFFQTIEANARSALQRFELQ